jgi:hypothetical protein
MESNAPTIRSIQLWISILNFARSFLFPCVACIGSWFSNYAIGIEDPDNDFIKQARSSREGVQKEKHRRGGVNYYSSFFLDDFQ